MKKVSNHNKNFAVMVNTATLKKLRGLHKTLVELKALYEELQKAKPDYNADSIAFWKEALIHNEEQIFLTTKAILIKELSPKQFLVLDSYIKKQVSVKLKAAIKIFTKENCEVREMPKG